MKKPKKAPTYRDARSAWKKDPDRLVKAMRVVSGPTVKGRYLHWEELKYRKPPKGLTHLDWWFAMKSQRWGMMKKIPMTAPDGSSFFYTMPDLAWELVHEIDKNAAGSVSMPSQIATEHGRNRYVVSSLIEEALRSSQIEGATATRKVAKELIRSGRKPRTKSEQMVLNNYFTMQRIHELRQEPLSIEMLLEIQNQLTNKTLRDTDAYGRFRRSDESIGVYDNASGDLLYIPPPAKEIRARLKRLINFANTADNQAGFIHPVVRAILLHFGLAYIHPFVDGNGRCARALFYWSMLKQGYWLCEYISISQVIHSAPAKYARAFLHSETDENDATYFVLFHLKIFKRAIEDLHKYLDRKARVVQSMESLIRASDFNHRQRALIVHALRHPGFDYTIASHRNSHGVVYETARADLLDLHSRGLLRREKVGRSWVFSPAHDLERQLQGNTLKQS